MKLTIKQKAQNYDRIMSLEKGESFQTETDKDEFIKIKVVRKR